MGSARQLAAFRITLGVFLVAYFARPMSAVLRQVGAQPRDNIPTWFGGPIGDLFSTYVVEFAHVGLVASVMLTLGLLTRLSAGVTLLSFFAVANVYFRYSFSHSEWPYLWFFCLVLALSPSGDAWSLDAWFRRKNPRPRRACGWATELPVVWMTLLYFSAAIQKMFPLKKGVYWLQGYTIQELYVERIFDSPFYWITGGAAFNYTDVMWPFTFMAIMAVGVELAPVLWLTRPHLRVPVYVMVLFLHIMIYLFTIPSFIWVFLCTAVLFVRPERFGDVPASDT